jgi:hypothetical protein
LDVLKRAGRLVLVIGIASILTVSTMQQVASANVADTHSTSLASRRSQLVDLARGEIGYQASPPGSNCAKYIDWWAGGPGNPDPCEAWCLWFVHWIVSNAQSTDYWYSDAPGLVAGWWEMTGDAGVRYTDLSKVQVGDTIVWESVTHIGVVTAISSDGTQIRVVSGNNSNDLVSEQWYARSSSIFIGGNIPTFY